MAMCVYLGFDSIFFLDNERQFQYDFLSFILMSMSFFVVQEGSTILPKTVLIVNEDLKNRPLRYICDLHGLEPGTN